MMTRVLVLLLALLPLPIIYWFTAKDRHYDEILKGIRDAQECYHNPCKIDFDGDTIAGSLYIDRASPADYYDSWLVATEKGQEILRLPYRRVDNTLRTHVGIRRGENGLTRLVVYDNMRLPGPRLSTVFVWNGKSLVQSNPSEDDQKVLQAMHARDDAGSFNQWVFYRTLKFRALTFYYILWGVCAWWIFRRAKRKQFSFK